MGSRLKLVGNISDLAILGTFLSFLIYLTGFNLKQKKSKPKPVTMLLFLCLSGVNERCMCVDAQISTFPFSEFKKNSAVIFLQRGQLAMKQKSVRI